MGRPAVLKVDIVADAKGVGKGVDDADRSFGKLGGAAKKAGLAIGAGLAAGAIAVGAFGVAAVREASNVQQAYGALESVYGKNAAQVKAWAEGAATNVGLSKAAYADLSAVVGSQLQGMGVAQDQAGAKTNDLIKMGADLAATFGGSVSDAVGAVGSLLRGEADPIERYGVSIKATDVAARLAAEGNDKLTGAALKTAQAQATLALLTDKTKNAHGAFSRETDTLAHQQQVLGAQFDNVKAKVGAGLLPILTSMATYVTTQLMPGISGLGGELSGKLGPTLDKVGAFVRTSVLPAFTTLRNYFMTSVLPALQQLGSFISTVVLPAFVAIAGFVLDKVVPAVTALSGKALGGLRSALATVQGAIGDNRDELAKIGTALAAVMAVVLKLAPVVGTVLATAFRTAGLVIGGVLDVIGAVVRAVESAMAAINRLRDAAGAVGNVVGKLNPFGGPPLATGLPQLVGGTDLAPRTAGLLTAAYGDPGPLGAAGGGRYAGGFVYVDQRRIDASVRVDGALDADAVARQVGALLHDRALRIGGAPQLAGARL